MMRVKVLYDGSYSKFAGQKSGVQHLQAGDEVEFPKWYAESLIADNIAERVYDNEAETVFAEDLEADEPLPAQVERHLGIDATEAAKEMAAEFGIELATVPGTGSGGRILVSDVRRAIDDDN